MARLPLLRSLGGALSVAAVDGEQGNGQRLFADGQTIEHGGELIDTGQTASRRLARDLGLDLDGVLRAEHTSTDDQGYLSGAVDTGILAAKEILADLRLPTAG